MTPKERAAMQQALEALVKCNHFHDYEDEITALREALAEQAEQEPVAWLWKPSKPFPQYTVITDKKEYLKAAKEQGVEITPLYASPVQQVEQEPVAAYKDAPRVIYLQTGCEDPEFCECSFNEWGDTTWCVDKIHDTDIPYIREDYAAPVRTKDLTDVDLWKLWEKSDSNIAFARAVIAADREKNK